MNRTRAALTAVLSVLVIMVGAVGIAAMASGQGLSLAGAPPAQKPVTKPVERAHASVNAKVSKEMDGPMDDVTIAEDVAMSPAPTGYTDLAGNGQGNGCLPHYGKPGQCLPLLSPAQVAMPEMDHPWTCPEVRELFPDGVEVHGKDKLELDTDGDGVACSPGDG